MTTPSKLSFALDNAQDAVDAYRALVTGHGTDEEIADARREMNRARARVTRARKALAAAQS